MLFAFITVHINHPSVCFGETRSKAFEVLTTKAGAIFSRFFGRIHGGKFVSTNI